MIIVPFTKFLPLIDEIRNIFNEIVQAAEYNGRICNALMQRVHGNNYLHLQDLITIIC